MKIRTVLGVVAIGLLSGILSILPQFVQAQTVKKCGIAEATARYYAEHPELQSLMDKTADLELEQQAKMQGQNQQQAVCSDLKVIPVVFHIIHENGAENISDQTVFDAIIELNKDYRNWNEDLSEVVSQFKPIIGEAFIEFRLAQIDPTGSPTNGIDRIQSAETNVGDDGSKLSPWPRNKYLNIWTVKVNPGGAAAYAYLPAVWVSASVDGIITNYSYVGEGERTLTHEVGHWISLRHVWGPTNDAGLSTNCSSDDGVGDTPNCEGTLGGCDTTKTTCGSLDNVQNHMDYASCERMFTAGQVTKMHAALNSSTAERNELWTSSNLIETGVDDGAIDFYTDLTTVCANTNVQFIDKSYNGICQWAWTFQGGTPSTSTDRQPTVIYTFPGTYDVALTVSNDTGSATKLLTDYITVTGTGTLPYTENFPDLSDWTVSGDANPTWAHTSDFTYNGSSGSMTVYNYGQGVEGDIDEMMSPGIDLSVLETAQITFRVAYAQIDNTTSDILRLYTSGDCGSTWTSSWIDGGSSLAGTNGEVLANWAPTGTADWTLFTATISPSVLTENFRFKFRFTSDEGNNIYIDNLNITGVYNNTPLLKSPPNFSNNQPSTVTMDWHAVDSVDFYEYEIDKSSTFSSPFRINGTTTYISSSNTGTDTEYILSALDSGSNIWWRVRTLTGTDTSAWSASWKYSTVYSVFSIPSLNASRVNLKVFPNPSNGDVTVSFDLDQTYSDIAIQVFDVLGREMDMPTNLFTQLSQGHHELKVSTLDHSGVYFVRLHIDEVTFHSRFTITK